jgi:hypothetical protein
MSFRKIRNTPH